MRVTNRGPLALKNVVLRIIGENGVLLSTAQSGATWGLAIDTTPLQVPGDGEATTAFYYFKPEEDTNNVSKALVSAKIQRWDADLSHLLNSYSNASAQPRGTYSNVVHPE